MSLSALAHTVKTVLAAEWQSRGHVDLSWRRRLWLYRHGILSERDAAWDLSAATVDDYLSDRQWSACRRLSRSYGPGLENKVLFRRLVDPSHGDLLPELYALLREGAVVERTEPVATVSDVLSVLEEHALVAKPVGGANGDAVHVLDSEDGQYRIDGRPVGREAVESALTSPRDTLLEARVEQADYAAAVYPDATNTVRLLTMVDRDGEPFVAGAMHRFGTAASGRIDNWNAGGLSAGIDLATGELGEAAVPEPDGYGVEWTTTHPDTGAAVTGRRVPAWDRVTDAVLDLAAEFGTLWPYVGWDVVVTDDAGSVTVLEGNEKPGLEALQAHQPLLRRERVREFFESHGIV